MRAQQLLTEIETNQIRGLALKTARHELGRKAKNLRAYFEHGQWWIMADRKVDGELVTETYSVIDCEPSASGTGLGLEQVS